MGEKANRNRPCPCGSGKKYKNCCIGKGLRFEKKDQSKMIIWIIAGIGIIIAGVVIFNKFSSSSSPPAPVITQPFNSQFPTSQSGSVPPPGSAPPGKVWSPEHGHWHDVSGTVSPTDFGNQLLQSPAQTSSQPPGPAPAGKVWSPEHGHWHDVQEAPTIKILETKTAPSDS